MYTTSITIVFFVHRIREYKSKNYVCKSCTQSQQCTQTVTRHVWHDYIQRAKDIRHSPLGKTTYALCSQTIERVFADAKKTRDALYTLSGG